MRQLIYLLLFYAIGMTLIDSCTSKSQYVTLDSSVQEVPTNDWELVGEIEYCKLYRKMIPAYDYSKSGSKYLYWSICWSGGNTYSSSITSIP